MYSAFARSPGSPGSFCHVPCHVPRAVRRGWWISIDRTLGRLDLGYLGMSGEKVGSHRRRSIDFHVVTEGHSIVKWNSNFI